MRKFLLTTTSTLAALRVGGPALAQALAPAAAPAPGPNALYGVGGLTAPPS